MTKMQKYKMLRVREDGKKALWHQAKNMKKDENVIIKEMKKKYFTEEDCNLCKEVQIQNKMKHENILKMLEMMHDDTELLMVFEHMPDNLKTVIKKRDGPFSEPETKGIMTQLLSAIAFIHKQGYLHCNIMPENLLCDEEGKVVKLTDFSVAKAAKDSPFTDMSPTPIWYTAPEVLLGSERYSTPIDVWSAGCIMGELLAGKPLMKGDSSQTQTLKICDFLGTFTRAEWPEGLSLQFNISYNLPKNAKAQGFAGTGFEGSSEAKELLLSLLKWSPQKRKTAEECLNDSYFKTSNAGGSGSSPEVQLQQLEDWKMKWGPNIASQSLEEFDLILQGLSTSRQQQHHGGGYGQTSNDMSPRGDERYHGNGMQLDMSQGREMARDMVDTERGYGQGQWNNGMETQRNGMDAQRNGMDTQRNGMDTQRNGMDAQRNGMDAQKNPFDQRRASFGDEMNNLEREVMEREEKRARHTIVNDDEMFKNYFGEAPRENRGQEPGQGNGQQQQGQGQDHGQGQGQGQGFSQGQGQQAQEPRYNARGMPITSREQRLRDTNTGKYNALYKNNLSYVLGGQGENGQKTDIYGNSFPDNRAGGQQRGPGNNSGPEQNSFNNNMQGSILESDDPNQSLERKPQRRDRELNQIKFKDHESAAKDLYKKNQVKYNHIYGNPQLRKILGNKPPGSRHLPDDDEESIAGKSNNKYTPTWAENGKGKSGRGNRK